MEKKGLSLWKKANAIDNSPIVPYHDRKSISSETTFQTDTIDVRKLKGHLTDMASKLAYKLRESQKLTATVTVKIRYSDFNTYSRQKQIPYTASENKLISHAHELLDVLYQRRVLIRLIGLKFSKLTHGSGSPQMDLFEDSEKEINLLQRLDHIRKRFGMKSIKRGSVL